MARTIKPSPEPAFPLARLFLNDVAEIAAVVNEAHEKAYEGTGYLQQKFRIEKQKNVSTTE